jgi:hypothetical protein
MTAGIALGAWCAQCTRQVATRASRIGHLAAAVTTLLLVGYLILRLRAVAPVWRPSARSGAVASVVVWYLLTYRIAKRIALQWQS